jgi:dUTP pyrophosphatase
MIFSNISKLLSMVKINIKMLDDSLPVPKYSHDDDAGLDLYSSVNCILKPFERKMIPTGIKVSIPSGFAGFIQPRSGLAAKKGLGMVNTPGLIDSGYRGEINVILINLDPRKIIEIRKGNKICQLVIQRIERADLKVVKKLDKTDRGERGFGSTGE